MGDVVPLFDPYNEKRALDRIKKLWFEGNFILLPHAKKPLQDDDLDILDVEHVIRYGVIKETTNPRKLWRYRIEGLTADRLRAACVIEIDDKAILITVFRLKH
jgi:hypothetical protein